LAKAAAREKTQTFNSRANAHSHTNGDYNENEAREGKTKYIHSGSRCPGLLSKFFYTPRSSSPRLRAHTIAGLRCVRRHDGWAVEEDGEELLRINPHIRHRQRQHCAGPPSRLARLAYMTNRGSRALNPAPLCSAYRRRVCSPCLAFLRGTPLRSTSWRRVDSFASSTNRGSRAWNPAPLCCPAECRVCSPRR
jgi:hypothetical protein